MSENILDISAYLQTLRAAKTMTKSELARRTGLSVLTIDRIAAGRPYRPSTKRKILRMFGQGVNVTPMSEDDPCHNGNRVRVLRERLLLSQVQLARKAKVTLRTIHNIEKGLNCRMDTKRRIILAFGLRIEHKNYVFPLKPKTEAL